MQRSQQHSNDEALVISAGTLYYRHNNGTVFTASMREIADAIEEEQPYQSPEAAGWPLGGTPYTPNPDSPEGRAVDDWTDAIDSAVARKSA